MLGRETLIGSPNNVVFYNCDTLYERQELTEQGDCCDYFQFSPRLLQEIVSAHHPQYDHGEPFQFTHSFVNRQNFARQRAIMGEIGRKDQTPNPLYIDEMAITLLESLIVDSLNQYGIQSSAQPKTNRTHRQLVFEAQKLLLLRYAEPLTLDQIAAILHVSPYHLSRLFRQQVGCTLHRFREQLRLRIAFERLDDYTNNLTRLALDVGYASHSHFTAAFRRAFGLPPTQMSAKAFN